MIACHLHGWQLLGLPVLFITGVVFGVVLKVIVDLGEKR